MAAFERRSPHSALDAAGRSSQRIASLFCWMARGGALVWLVVMALASCAIRSRRRDRRQTYLFVIGGGAAFPFAVLTALLLWLVT